jgi:hypothetical protein
MIKLAVLFNFKEITRMEPANVVLYFPLRKTKFTKCATHFC